MVGTLIVAAAAGTTAAGVAASFALTAAAFAVNFAVSMIITRMFGDNPEKQQDMGVRQQVPPSAVNAIPIVYGDAYMGGTFVDAVLTTDQKTMYYVLAISSISSANSTLGTSAGVFNYDMSDMYYGDRLISFSSSGSVQSGRIFNGGTGYVVGDVITILGGSFTTAAVFTVSEVASGGVITAANLTTPGSYTSAPNNPALVTGGTGTGASGVLKFSVYTNTVTALTDEAGNVDTKINTNLYINIYKSSSAGVITSVNGADLPSVVMGGSDISAAQQWTGTRQMNNLAFAIVKLVYNRDADTTQLNPITFRVSHYPNGASVAKPGDVWLDYITNQDYGGAVGWLPDGSFTAAFVDTTCVAPLNTYSDALITYTPAGGGATVTQSRYRINGVLDAGQTVLSNLDRIMSSCDSWMTYNAALGQWSVVINKAETTAYAFNDNNIIGDIRVSATDITSSINQVEARFPFKANRDQASFVNIETPYALLYPNEPVNKYSITYDLVNDSVQAQYLANRLLEQAREDLIVSFSTTYYGIQVDAGTVVSVTNADYGWNAKLFRVMKVNEASLPDGSLGARLELSEYNAQVYDDASIQQFTPAPNSGLPSVSYFSPLSAPTVTGFASATIPYINVQVFIPATGRVTFNSLFWTTSATPTPADWKLVATASTTNNQPVTNGTYYTYSNITLNTGTYYFAYNVGNDITTSTLSPISAAFVWNPVAGAGPTGATGPTGTSTTGPTGQAGLQVARPAVYQWALSTPSISGASTYFWSTASYAGPGGGWSTTITAAPSAGFILYTATATVTDIATATSTPFSWTTASIVVSGYAGTNGATGPTGGAGVTGPTGGTGASVRIMYARIASNPTPVSGTVTVSGDNRPTGAQGSAVWGASFNVTWYANDPDPTSNNSLYQADGIYNGTNTSWSTPYISSLKVGALSAVSTNTGSLTISGTLQSNTATISGTTMTGSGGVLYASGNFAFGNSTANIAFNGTDLTLNGLANKSKNNLTSSANINAYYLSNPSAFYYNLLTMTKANGVTGIMQCATSFNISTNYPAASYVVVTIYFYANGNNGWIANLGTYRATQILNGTASVYPAVRNFAFPLSWSFLFNTTDFGSSAVAATSINLTIQYTASYYDSSSNLLTSAPSIGDIVILGANTSFYQPLLGS